MKFDKSCKLPNIFLWFLKASWIARGSEISLLKFDKSWNVLEALKYFSIILKSLLDYQKVRNIFPEVWQVLECPGSFKIFFYDFLKPLGLPEGQKYLYWSLTSPAMSWKLKKFSMIFKSLLDCQKVKKNFLEVWQVLECLESFKIFFYDF